MQQHADGAGTVLHDRISQLAPPRLQVRMSEHLHGFSRGQIGPGCIFTSVCQVELGAR